MLTYKMYIVVFFLLLWSLFQLVLCQTQCAVTDPDPNTLYILQTNHPLHKKMNKEFENNLLIALYEEYSYTDYPIGRTPMILDNCSTNLAQLMEHTKNLSYVIDLYVEDYYQNNKNVVKNNNFSWIGDIAPIKTTVCKSNAVKKDDMETCNAYTEPRPQYVKIVSDKVLDIPLLTDLVRNYPLPPNMKKLQHKILICTDPSITDTNWSDYDEEISYYDVTKKFRFLPSNCNRNSGTIPRLRDDVIAVLAPNPEWIEETNKPMIFYDEPYAIPEETAFYNNSIMRQRSWKRLTNTFLRFIWKMNWNRVAIVSDDAVESEEFEKKIRTLFDTRKVSYIVESVGNMNKCCDFNKALDTLKKADARIIIANVDERHALLLANQASSHGMTIAQNVVWITRGWSEATALEAAKDMLSVYTISPKATDIMYYIDAIKQVMNKNRNNKSYNFYNNNQFARDIRQALSWQDDDFFDTQFEVTRATFRGKQETIITYIRGKATFSIHPHLPKDRSGNCNIKSSNYYKPCDDIYVILLLLVVATFAVTALGITYFFQNPDTPYNRMVN